MGLSYPEQNNFAIIGTQLLTSPYTRTPWTLTATYPTTETGTNALKSFRTTGMSKLNLDCLYTVGSAETSNSFQLRIEVSPDGTNWYAIPNESVSGGTSTLTAREFTFVGNDATTATISIGLDIFNKFIRVAAKETGVVTNFGTLYIEATTSGR